MTYQTALVTGAGGFIGCQMVSHLAHMGLRVRAGVRYGAAKTYRREASPGVEVVELDICDIRSLNDAMMGVDVVYHFAALVDAHAPRKRLYMVNVEGTANVWRCAAQHGVRSALYCSSTAVYGLLATPHQPISEAVMPRAVEPYGRSKLLGEKAALDVAAEAGLPTVIIRPVAVFGPREKTPFGQKVRRAAFSKLLLATGFQNRPFCYVHVEDVVAAAIHLMPFANPGGDLFNISSDTPVTIDAAFRAYRRALKKAPLKLPGVRVLAVLSKSLHRFAAISGWVTRRDRKGRVFNLWQPGYDLVYTSRKLRDTSFQFKWRSFEAVLLSCINDPALLGNVDRVECQ